MNGPSPIVHLHGIRENLSTLICYLKSGTVKLLQASQAIGVCEETETTAGLLVLFVRACLLSVIGLSVCVHVGRLQFEVCNSVLLLFFHLLSASGFRVSVDWTRACFR